MKSSKSPASARPTAKPSRQKLDVNITLAQQGGGSSPGSDSSTTSGTIHIGPVPHKEYVNTGAIPAKK